MGNFPAPLFLCSTNSKFNFFLLKNKTQQKRGAEKITQPLEMLAALADSLSSVSNNHRVIHNYLDFQFQRTYHPLLASVGTAHMCCT